jgi:tripeptide aminopeptidase
MATQAAKTKTKKKPVSNSGKSRHAKPRPTVDLRGALRMALELMAIRGTSGQESGVAAYITKKLREAGAPASAIRHDNAHQKSPLKGQIGNLIFQLPGTVKAPRRLLMAHMDTVPVCLGSKPVRKGDIVRSADPKTGLGADDRAGVAVVLNAAIEILKHRLPHPPLTFFWPIEEEVGLHGAHYVQQSLLGKPRLAFNWDGGAAERITTAATGGYRLQIEIEGLAAHAGVAPQHGISAIAIASLATAHLVQGGWHGLIEKDGRRGTSNIGFIHGGEATNVVTDRVEIKAEARSHDHAFRKRIVAQIEQAFRDAAEQVRNEQGRCGSVRFHGRTDYEAFRLADDEPCVLAADRAVRAAGLEPVRCVSNGGLDANWMSAHGIPTVTLGCGQNQIHTTSEFLEIAAFEHACKIAIDLATHVD